MKRLLVYFSVLVGCLFIGLTTYYMVKDYDEFIVNRGDSNGVVADNSFYMNKGETETIKATINKQSEDTELLYSFDTEGVATYDIETGILTAVKGGTTKLKIYTNKENLGFYEYDVSVGDGSDDNGWFIKSQSDLKAIGGVKTYGENIVEWNLSDTYELLNDIELEGEWEPICKDLVDVGETEKIQYFSGKFRGNGHSIKNMTITKDYYMAGFFAALDEIAEITNLKLDNVNMSGYYYYAGAIAGISYGAKIERIEVTNAKISAKPKTNLELISGKDENNIGGLVGVNQAYVIEGSEYVNHSKISLSTFNGTIQLAVPDNVNTVFSVGGIVGYNIGGEIHNNKATVSFLIASKFAQNPDTSKCQVGGIIGTSYIYNPNKNEFDSETKDLEVIYPIIINNLALINFDNVTARMGGIIGQRGVVNYSIIGGEEVYNSLTQELKDAVDATIEKINQKIISRISGNLFNTDSTTAFTASYEGCESKGIEALKLLSTYTNAKWSIGEPSDSEENTPAWIIVDKESIAEVNLDGINEDHKYSQIVIELNQSNFKDYIENMLLDGSTSEDNKVLQKYWLSREYKLVEDIDLSTIFTTWTPISYRDNDLSFIGIFDGNGYTIKNLNIVNIKNTETGELNYSAVGFFATIGSTGIVKNLKLENVTIDNANLGGAIAGLNYGLIENCQVQDVKISDATKAGFVVGHNKGIVKTTKALETETAESEDVEEILQYTVQIGQNFIKSNVTKSSVFLGGITGYNEGKIIGIKIQSSFEISGATIIDSPVIKMIGGIAGYNGGDIILSAVESANIKDMSRVYTYMGGIAGLSNGLISQCHAGLAGDGFAITIIGELNEANNMVGGLVGQLSTGAQIEKSFVKADLKSFYVAGIAANLFGKVSECYVTGSISGEYVGGISVNVSLTDTQAEAGNVSDCYIKANLSGNSKKSVVAGLSTYILYPGEFNRVIISVTFSGVGNRYFESFTDTRTGFYNFINSFAGTKFGKVYNIVIDESIVKSEDKVVKNGGAINYEGQSAYYTDTATITAGEDFFKDKEFSMTEGSIWYMPAGEGKFPELRNVNIDGNYQNTVSEEGETPETPSGTETPETPSGTEAPSGTETPSGENE